MKYLYLNSIPSSFLSGEIYVERDLGDGITLCRCLDWWEVRDYFPSDSIIKYLYPQDGYLRIRLEASSRILNNARLLRSWKHLRLKEEYIFITELDG